MSLQRRNFHLLVAMVWAVSIPAWAQAVLPAVGPVGSVTRGVPSIPDFSGTWAHPYLTGFEPPASGPGPVLNRSRGPNGVANFQQLVGDYTNPILQHWAAEVVKTHGEISLAGQGYPTPSNQCWPGGVPYVFWDFLLQIYQRPDLILMIYAGAMNCARGPTAGSCSTAKALTRSPRPRWRAGMAARRGLALWLSSNWQPLRRCLL